MRPTLSMLAAMLALTPAQEAGQPAGGFAAVVHPSNPTRNLRYRNLLALFEGGSRQWPNSAGVVLVERDEASAPFRYLMGNLLNITPGEYKRRLQNIEYRGDGPVSIKILNSDRAACQFVFNVPSAIAIVETSSLDSPACGAVQVLRIDGKLPGEEGYRLK